MNDLEPLYDRLEVLEKTVAMLLEHLRLELIQHGDVYVELRAKDEPR